MVCGPTASGKSGLADDLADDLTAKGGSRTPTVVVDSMQVYRGIGRISNQARRRPAGLVGVVPVTERWTVARHREATDALAAGPDFVLDAGTGMYLNAVLLDFPLAPPVPPEVRASAQRASAGAANPRRSSRERELLIAGAEKRGSIWEGRLRYGTKVFYIRPERGALDLAIARRSSEIAEGGLEEAEALREMVRAGEDVNPSVLESIGVAELLDLLSGRITPAEAEERIAARTRRLARKQIRWFDKLVRVLGSRAGVVVAESPAEAHSLHTMHDTIGG